MQDKENWIPTLANLPILCNHKIVMCLDITLSAGLWLCGYVRYAKHFEQSLQVLTMQYLQYITMYHQYNWTRSTYVAISSIAFIRPYKWQHILHWSDDYRNQIIGSSGSTQDPRKLPPYFQICPRPLSLMQPLFPPSASSQSDGNNLPRLCFFQFSTITLCWPISAFYIPL